MEPPDYLALVLLACIAILFGIGLHIVSNHVW